MFNPLAFLEMKQDWPIQAQLWSETIQYPGALRRRPLAFSKAQRKQHDSVILHYANPKDWASLASFPFAVKISSLESSERKNEECCTALRVSFCSSFCLSTGLLLLTPTNVERIHLCYTSVLSHSQSKCLFSFFSSSCVFLTLLSLHYSASCSLSLLPSLQQLEKSTFLGSCESHKEALCNSSCSCRPNLASKLTPNLSEMA